MAQYSITASEWTQVAGPGVSGAVWLDEDSDGAGGSVDVRVAHGLTAPGPEIVTESKRIFRPAGNTDFLMVSPPGALQSTWARCKSTGDTATLTFSESVGVQAVKAHSFNTESDGAVRVQIQDNLTGLTSFKAAIWGHVVS